MSSCPWQAKSYIISLNNYLPIRGHITSQSLCLSPHYSMTFPSLMADWIHKSTSTCLCIALVWSLNRLHSCPAWTRIYPAFASSVAPDHLASKKPNDLDLHCLLFSMWICVNNLDQVIWLAENLKWARNLNLFNMTRDKIRANRG